MPRFSPFPPTAAAREQTSLCQPSPQLAECWTVCAQKKKPLSFAGVTPTCLSLP